MILSKTRKGFPSGRGKKCSKPSMNNLYKDTAFVGSGRNNCIHASSWFLFNQTCLLCKINKILTKAWLMMYHANRQHSDWEVPITDNGWLWAMMQILVFTRQKLLTHPIIDTLSRGPPRPKPLIPEPRTQPLTTPYTNMSLMKNCIRFVCDSCLS